VRTCDVEGIYVFEDAQAFLLSSYMALIIPFPDIIFPVYSMDKLTGKL
jgi:hypothetical protein